MRLILIKSILLLGIFLCFSSNSAFGQCVNKSTNYKPKVFESVSDKDFRLEIISRYNQFVSSYCKHDFANIYKMLSPSYLKSIRNISGAELTEQEWVKDKMEFYSDEKTRFISFAPKEIIESYDEKGNIDNVWQIYGCLTQIIDGRKRKVEGKVIVSKKSNGFYFNEIEPLRFSMDGKTQKCRF